MPTPIDRGRPGRDRRAVRHPGSAGRAQAPAGARPTVAVVGGGIAGISAAVGLAERGVGVTLLERHAQLGGRVRAWPVTGPAGTQMTMSRGFHAFFRQYYNLRALLRRADPELNQLIPVPDYPLWHADGMRDSFVAIPRQPPWSLLAFVLRSPSFRLADLGRVHIDTALQLLDVDFPRTFAELDDTSAEQFLAAMRFPPAARHLALEVFSRSFFAHPSQFCAAELVAMFHSYFIGSAEGLLFDVPADDYDTALWAPLARYLARRGARIRTGAQVIGLAELPGGALRVECADGTSVDVDAVVLGTDVATTRQLVATADWLGDQRWRQQVADGMTSAPPFVVGRLWLDRPVRPDRAAFLATAGFGPLDNVSVLNRFEIGAARWAQANAGAVVEVHAYAVRAELAAQSAVLQADLRSRLDQVYPELRGAASRHEEWLLACDCPLIAPGPWSNRPSVRTPDPRVLLAGDGIRCDYPVALMERAATTGWQAANMLLGRWGLAGHDLWTVPMAGRYRPVVRPLRRLAQLADRLNATRRG